MKDEKMKLLMLAGTQGLLRNTNRYNGGGWVASLQREIMKSYSRQITISLAFPSERNFHEEYDGVDYYGIEQIIEKRKLIPYLCIAIYCSGIFITIISNKAFYIFDIFRENNRIIQEDNIIISYDEIKLLDYYNTNINTRQQDTYVTVTTGPRAIWLYVLTRNPYFYINLVFGDNVTQMEQFEQNYRKYFVLLKRDFEGDYENLNLENVKILFENEAGMVIEKN